MTTKGTATGIIITTALLLGGLYLANEEFNLFSILDLGPGECYTNADCRSGQTCHIDYLGSPALFDETSGNNNEWCLEVCPSDAAYCEIRRYFSGWKPWTRFERGTTPLSIDEYPYQLYGEECRIYNWEIVVYKYKGECQGAVCGNGIPEEGEDCEINDRRIEEESCELPDSGCAGIQKVRYSCIEPGSQFECTWDDGVPISKCEKSDPCCGVSCPPKTKNCDSFCSNNMLCEYPKSVVTITPKCENGICVDPGTISCGTPECRIVAGECGTQCDSSNPCQPVEKSCDPYCDGFEYCEYPDDKVPCTPECISGVCGTCQPDCGEPYCRKVIGECNFGDIYVTAHTPYSIVEDVKVDVSVPEAAGWVNGEVFDLSGNSVKSASCFLVFGECSLKFGKLNLGDYYITVSRGGLEVNRNIQILGQILVETFPEASEQTAPVEMYFKVMDHTRRGLESWEIDDFTITVNDGGVKKTLGNEHITYVGTEFTSFNPGNFKVDYDPVSFGNILFTGEFRKNGYFDGKAEKMITLKTAKMSISGETSQSATLGETKSIEWKIVEKNTPVNVQEMTVTVVDSNDDVRKTLGLNDLTKLGDGHYSFSQKFDFPELWSVQIFAEKGGYEPLNAQIGISVSPKENPTVIGDVVFLIIGIIAVIIVIFVLVKGIRGLRR